MKSLKIWKGVLMLPLLAGAFLFSGCAGMLETPLYQSQGTGFFEANMVDVKISVLLEKEYVQKAFTEQGWLNRPLGLGVTSETLSGIIRGGEKPEDIRTFGKVLVWGEQSFNIRAPKNSEIQFKLSRGSSGLVSIDIGSVKVGTEATQTVVVNLTAAGASIK